MRNIVTGEDVEIAIRSGEREIVVGPDDIITSVAHEVAERGGIRFVRAEGSAHGEASPDEGTTPKGTAEASSAPSGLDLQVGERARAEQIPQREASSVPPFDMDWWRKQFPILEHYLHVANCSQAPQSTFTREAAMEYLDSWNQMGMDWERWMEEIHYAKEEFGRLINASPGEIAVGTSVSELTSTIASSLPLDRERNKVVVTDAEFPTVGHVWLANRKYGFEVDFIPVKNGIIEVDDYDRYVDEKTIITSACDTYYYNGFRQDLSRIIPKIHEKGSLVYVDAYQGLGTHALDVKALDVDILASGNLKYLLGVPGIAFLYVKKEIIEYLQPAFTGWFGQENPFAFDIHNFIYATDARRFDNGTPPVPTAYIARAGMGIINRVGVENIYRWTNVLSEHCLRGAMERGLDVASPTDLSIKAPNTAIRVPGDSHEFELALREKGVIASARSDVVRIAPHFFITLEDIDYILDCYAELLKKKRNGQRLIYGKMKVWNLG
ncbi:MAG: aminotransferase class V-fold PLP-dependent enzyme [Deltaproteobacteria bacterium]|nr:aminotransferase class V-fold PLP-dependent enzyme [Deltaproteobacteria bacterium]MBW2137480.1 aminotransferase class V-fold PLP-dependent enzyme [Deltaproteobacteria bacterium]